jgi:predicted dehydrogenase
LYVNGSIPTQWDDIAVFRGVTEGDVIKYAIPKPEPLRREHENFRDAVLGKDAEIVNLQQGLETVIVADAVLESANTGTTINIK